MVRRPAGASLLVILPKAARQPQKSSATLALSKSTASVVPPINHGHAHETRPPGAGAAAIHAPVPHPRAAAPERTTEHWAGLHERSQGGPLRALVKTARAACAGTRSHLNPDHYNATQRRIAVARRATSRRPTKSPRRQRSHPQPRHRVSLPNAPSNSAAAATSANPDAAGRVASHPHPTARPPAPPLGTARGRSCRRVDEDTRKKMSPRTTRCRRSGSGASTVPILLGTDAPRYVLAWFFNGPIRKLST